MKTFTLSILFVVLSFSNAQAQKKHGVRPKVVSINRQIPTYQTTNATSVTFRATFSESVTGVDATDFSATVVSGSLNSSIAGVTVVNSSTYDITISITGSGTLRLDLKASNTGITDIAGNSIAGGYTPGETYIINQTAPTVVS